jgi:H+-translocating NAD(P) transhydrogenase subunit alpha
MNVSAHHPPVELLPGMDIATLFFIFILAGALGFELISKVPAMLHTPLMSGANAISGITLVGALLAAGGGHDTASLTLGVAAITFATLNVVGGYLVTDRMLKMFRRKERK